MPSSKPPPTRSGDSGTAGLTTASATSGQFPQTRTDATETPLSDRPAATNPYGVFFARHALYDRIPQSSSIIGHGPELERLIMNSQTLTLSGFQHHIFEKYEKVDRARGTPKTFLWFIEEVGELATALNGTDRANLEEEFADVLAWLCTLANINDIDLAAVVQKKYLGDRAPEGHK